MDIQLRFDEMRTGRVTFPTIPVLKSGNSYAVEIRGTVTDVNGKEFASFKMRDIELLLAAEWNSYNDLARETVEVPCHVDYRDAPTASFQV